MSVKLLRGDILASKAPLLVIPVNKVGVAGAGLALAFRHKYPKWFEFYLRWCREGADPEQALYTLANGQSLYAAVTKDRPENKSTLEHVTKACEYIYALSYQMGFTWVGVPALGCGKGQLDWKLAVPTMAYKLWLIEKVDLYLPHGNLA